MLFAGTDTTATTLAYIFFELARHPAWYERLRAELSSAFASATAASSSTSSATTANPLAGGRNGAENEANAKRATEVDVDDDDNAVVSAQLTYATVKALPVLNAVVWETLRMYPAIPSSLARRVPRGGAPVTGVLGDGGSGGNAWLPADTVVSASTVTLQRNADVFPDPYTWRPERWLARKATPAVPLFPPLSSSSPAASLRVDPGDDKARLAETDTYAAEVEGNEGLAIYEVDDAMSAHMQVFSRGIRACLGKPIAHMEMKLAAAALAQRYAGVRLADARATANDMRMMDAFVLVPKGKRCMLVFD